MAFRPWANAILDPNTLHLFGWAEIDIIGFASVVSPLQNNQFRDIAESVSALDLLQIPFIEKKSVFKDLVRDPSTGRSYYAANTTASGSAQSDRAFQPTQPLRAGSRAVNWVAAPEQLATSVQYEWHPSVQAFWTDHSGVPYFPELTGGNPTDPNVGDLIEPATSKTFKDALRVLAHYGDHNTADKNIRTGVYEDVSLPIPQRVSKSRKLYSFPDADVTKVKSDTNKGKIFAAHDLLPRLTQITDATLYAINEGLREADEIASELRNLFHIIKTAPDLPTLQATLAQAFEEVYEHAPAGPLPESFEFDFTRVYEAAQGVPATHDLRQFSGQQSVRSLRTISHMLRGELRHQYESTYNIIYPDRPRFTADNNKKAVVPRAREVHAAASFKADTALENGLKGKGANSPRGRGKPSTTRGRGKGYRGRNSNYQGNNYNPNYRGRGRGRGNHYGGGYESNKRHQQSNDDADSGGGEASKQANDFPHTPRGRGRGGGRNQRGRGGRDH
ncbi:MAG: hypothetical protein COB29_15490 [Sulfitobacter sp.]|nr:MAG: hypothetical protein COB29_15490 [Sulfitobacter sp.]